MRPQCLSALGWNWLKGGNRDLKRGNGQRGEGVFFFVFDPMMCMSASGGASVGQVFPEPSVVSKCPFSRAAACDFLCQEAL